MGVVVHRGAAAVKTYLAALDWLKDLQCPSKGVIKGKRHGFSVGEKWEKGKSWKRKATMNNTNHANRCILEEGRNNMSETYTEITLKNAGDVAMEVRGLIKESGVRQTTVRALVDTGSSDLVINEAIRQKLGLEIERSGEIELANNYKETFLETEPVRVYWKDRATACSAVIMPGQADQRSVEVLLGVLPMEALDLTVNPFLQEVTGAHGNKKLYKAK
ncbi:hypothetical protein AGMMS49940_18780 [Spirochaetia bacterium]|nr:hypothetical protein AGMMS49940_18780 [Spirochaetia bacterium]